MMHTKRRPQSSQWFDYQAVDDNLSGKVYDEEEERREKCRAIIQMLYFVQNRRDYRQRLYSILIAIDAPMFYSLGIEGLAARCNSTERALLTRCKIFKGMIPITAPVQEVLVKLIENMVNNRDYMLRIDVMMSAVGMAQYDGMSFTKIAERHGISKQAYVKHVIKFQTEFCLPPTRVQKSLRAREVYRNVARLRQTSREEEVNKHSQKNDNQEDTKEEVTTPWYQGRDSYQGDYETEELEEIE